MPHTRGVTHHSVTETGRIDDDRKITNDNNLEKSRYLTLYTDNNEHMSLGVILTGIDPLKLSRKQQYTNTTIMLQPTQFTNW